MALWFVIPGLTTLANRDASPDRGRSVDRGYLGSFILISWNSNDKLANRVEGEVRAGNGTEFSSKVRMVSRNVGEGWRFNMAERGIEGCPGSLEDTRGERG
jgi:hypothetical protein